MATPGVMLSENAAKRTREAVRFVEQYPLELGSDQPPRWEHRPPIVGILKDRLVWGKTAAVQVMTWDPGEHHWAIVHKDRDEVVVAATAHKVYWNKGEQVTAIWIAGVGYAVVSDVLWAGGNCGSLPAHAALVVKDYQQGSPKKGTPRGSELAQAEEQIGMIALVSPGQGKHGNDVWLEDYAFSAESLDPFDEENPADAIATGPVPCQTHLPAWVLYDPEDPGGPPKVNEIWGPRAGAKNRLVREPTFTREIEFKHQVDLNIELGPLPGSYEPCHCVVESAAAVVHPYTETCVYGWRVLAVDEEHELVYISHVTNFAELIVQRVNAEPEFNFDVEDGDSPEDEIE